MKVKRFEGDSLITYSFHCLEDLKNKIEEWKREFHEINRVDGFRKDKSYERYCEELDDLINQYAEG